MLVNRKNDDANNYVTYQYALEELESNVLKLLRNRTISFNGLLKILDCCPSDLNYTLNRLAEKGLIEERS